MKNIHLIPTDKPSRLYEGNLGKPVTIQSASAQLKKPLNIYITNDEEIKEETYFLEPINNSVLKLKDNSDKLIKSIFPTCKKIILTTDQDLIADGVQAIDDEFLEWFCKNSSCERVEVEKWTDYKLENDKEVPFFNYKIIIPKEEPKQLNSEDFGLPKIGTKEFNDLASALFGGKPKQETLEEVAEKYATSITKKWIKGDVCNSEKEDIIVHFVSGAKWQQENSNINALHFEIDSLKREIKVFKHQQEQDKNKYSEEDLISLLEFNYKKETNQLGTLRKDYSQKIVREWFEQFKKK